MTWTNKDKVVVPVDLSEFSFSALGVARSFVDHNSNLYVLHVIREINPKLKEGLLGREVSDERPQICQETLNGRLINEYPGIQMHIETGEPGEAIANYASSIQANLIVMTSHGRRGMKEQLIGSVAERVVRLANCSVLILKPHAE